MLYRPLLLSLANLRSRRLWSGRAGLGTPRRARPCPTGFVQSVVVLLAALCTVPGLNAQENLLAGEPPALLDARDRILYPSDTERLKPLTRKLVRNVLMDQKEIWTSPFRVSRKNAKWWIGIGAVTAGLVATDNWTSTQLRNSQGQVRWSGRVARVGAPYTLLPLVAGFYGWGAVFDDPKARETGMLGMEALIDSFFLVQTLKSVAGRNRPDTPDGRGDFFSGGTSFPSGHSIQSWSLAAVIAHQYQNRKWVPVLAYGLAGAVSAARFGGQRHFASDVVLGAGMGWFIGRYVVNVHKNHAIQRSRILPKLLPTVDPATRTYSIGLTWGTVAPRPVERQSVNAIVPTAGPSLLVGPGSR